MKSKSFGRGKASPMRSKTKSPMSFGKGGGSMKGVRARGGTKGTIISPVLGSSPTTNRKPIRRVAL